MGKRPPAGTRNATQAGYVVLRKAGRGQGATAGRQQKPGAAGEPHGLLRTGYGPGAWVPLTIAPPEAVFECLRTMRLRTKIILLAVLPLVASLSLIALTVRHLDRDLILREHAVVERAYMQARRNELRNYVELAVSVLRPLAGRAGNDPADRADALRLLAALNYGTDGYFFVYDMDGTVLMHARQPELVGRNLSDLRDPLGRPTIQALLARARAGGGYEEYLWHKPSTGQVVPKLGYVTALEPWHWMLGTGLYLDDIRDVTAALELEAERNIQATLAWIAGLAVLGVAFISVTGLLLNLSEHRIADTKLRLMAQQVVQSQEDERARLARELHDGTSQTLVSSKLLVESAVAALERNEPSQGPLLARALDRLNASLVEIRRISHRLRPALLDTLGLPAALEHLGREFGESGRHAVQVTVLGTPHDLPEVVKTMLFRVAQEGLTNIAKHAGAAAVELVLEFGHSGGVLLRVSDDGPGFDVRAVQAHPQRGLGLRSMRERLASMGGRLEVESGPGQGTQVQAHVSASALARLGREAASHALAA
jgi:two-component system NarL family sensor kinase